MPLAAKKKEKVVSPYGEVPKLTGGKLLFAGVALDGPRTLLSTQQGEAEYTNETGVALKESQKTLLSADQGTQQGEVAYTGSGALALKEKLASSTEEEGTFQNVTTKSAKRRLRGKRERPAKAG